jgi:hypothetical protein
LDSNEGRLSAKFQQSNSYRLKVQIGAASGASALDWPFKYDVASIPANRNRAYAGQNGK